MNTRRSNRRITSGFAAILAALLMASVLAVIAGSPAQAANTSSEALVDTNGGGVLDAREFGGRDRYDTALRLAGNFGKAKGLGNVPTAFVASGVSLVDAVSVSGLAGFLDAPVLLTPMGNLHGGVEDFIEDYGVDTIYVLGGNAAIADSVLEDMEALVHEPTVTRIEGTDRYATAAAVAAELGGGAAWCGGEDAAAILVNGGDVSLAEAMMVGPIANRLHLPVLMTAADELPSATSDFIEAEDIEHVVIVGGTVSVTDDVASALTDAGVDTVDRIAGDTAAGTSVELAELAGPDGDCNESLGSVSDNTVALVHRDALPDGIAAAPVLTSTYADGFLVPILVVGDTLPASVRDYLAATPNENDAGAKVNLRIVAIGGTAAVSQSVMDAALAAAASADALTVKIGATTDKNEDGKIDAGDVPESGDMAVTLYFSDDVIADDTSLEAKIRDVIELNGAPARLGTQDGVERVGTDDGCNPDEVTVTFASALKAGDTVALIGGLKLGAAGDERPVGATSLTIAAPVPDRSRPTISAIMIAGRGTAEVTVSTGDPILVTGTEITLRNTTAGDTKEVSIDSDGNLDFTAPLVAGDRVTIPSGAVEDAAGNKSPQRSFTAINPHKNPRITAVLMSNLKHSAQATTNVPAAVAADSDEIAITAKADGDAAGAAGNVWSMVFDVASTWKADPDAAVDIDVRVSSRDKVVFVRFNTGDAKYGDLKDALEGDSGFDAMFEVELPANTADGAGCNATLNKALALANDDRQVTTGLLTGGMTQVAIEVRFNGYVNTVVHDGLLADLVKEVVDRDNGLADTSAVTTALGLGSPDAFVGPKTTVRYEAITSNAAALPQVRGLVITLAGADAIQDDPATANVDEEKAVVAAIATGYAAVADNDEKNAASQVRIGRSNSVKAPAAPTG